MLTQNTPGPYYGENSQREIPRGPSSAKCGRARLSRGYVLSLQTLRALLDFEFHQLAFVQRFVAFRLNGRKVDEDIFARLPLDESIPFCCIEPLHHTLFSIQLFTSSCLKYRFLRSRTNHAASHAIRPPCKSPSGGILTTKNNPCPENARAAAARAKMKRLEHFLWPLRRVGYVQRRTEDWST